MQVGRVVAYKIKNYNQLLLITFNILWKFHLINKILNAKILPCFSCILPSGINLKGGFYNCYVQKFSGTYPLRTPFDIFFSP